MEYLIHIVIIILLYIMLSQSLMLTAGYPRLISLAHAGFYGIGAYTTAILSVEFQFSFIATLPLAIILCGLFAASISFIALRTVDDYFIIITFGIQVVAFSIMNNWMAMTNGPIGIGAIPSIKICGFIFDTKLSFLLLTLFFSSIVFYFLSNITKSPFGRLLMAISEDEVFVASLGKSVHCTKVVSFTISGMIAAIPGVLYAHYVKFIDPTSFTVNESIFILSIVIIGGMRSLWGSAIVAAVLVILPEALRFIGISSNVAANLQQIIYGLALVIILLRYNQGLISKKYIGVDNQ